MSGSNLAIVQPGTAPPHAFPHLFFALLALTALSPLSTGGSPQRLIYFVVTLAVLAAVIRLCWFLPRTRIATVILAVPATIAAAFAGSESNEPFAAYLLIFTAAFFILATVRLLNKIVRDRVVTTDTLYGAACIYLLIGITWALLYAILSWWQPGTLSYAKVDLPTNLVGGWPNHVYFSFMTLATVGYGDIIPATQLARSIVILEVVSGVFYVALLVGRLVDLYRPTAK
jgi:voltage-gated potassium channel